MGSLRARLLVAGSVPLMCFFLASALILDHTVRDYARASLEDRMRGIFYGLLAMVEYRPDIGFHVSEALPDPQLRAMNTGLAASIRLANDLPIWDSPGLARLDLKLPAGVEMGESKFTFAADAIGVQHAVYNFTIGWEVGPEEITPLMFYVIQDASEYRAQVLQIRLYMLTGVLALAVLLLLVQAYILRRGLAPLRQIESDLSDLEHGNRRSLQGNYPREIGSLANALNEVLDGQQQQLERYRNTLSDLAHGLKTPLTVVRNELDSGQIAAESRTELDAQVARMSELVEYHLRRGQAAGQLFAGDPVNLNDLVAQIRNTLVKLYRDRDLVIESELPDDLSCRIDRQDLLEVLGNLAENACKWAQRRVRISALRGVDEISLVVEDDGDGISPADRSRILRRGERADESAPGHGLGLAIVLDIVELAGGRLEIGDSELGGARIRATWPDPV